MCNFCLFFLYYDFAFHYLTISVKEDEDNERTRLLNNLQSRVADQEKLIENDNMKYERYNVLLDSVQEQLKSFFFRIGCENLPDVDKEKLLVSLQTVSCLINT